MYLTEGEITMSFDTLKIADLKQIASDFAVDTESLKNKKDLIAALSEEGVTWSVYAKTLENLADEEIKEDAPIRFDHKKELAADMVLVRMTRENHRYDILGVTFTKQHPFAPMSSNQAQEIFDKEEGFRLATPNEVQSFYS